MDGIQNAIIPPGVPVAPAIPAPASAPAAAPQVFSPDSFVGGAPAQDASGALAALRAQIMGGNGTMAIPQLAPLLVSNRAQALPVLLEQLSSNSSQNVLAAIEVLRQARVPEALPYLQSLNSSGDQAIASAANSASDAISGKTTPLASPQAALPALPGGQPVSPQAPLSSAQASLLAQLTDPSSASSALSGLAQLPTAQMIGIAQRALQDFQLSPSIVSGLTGILAQRVNEPGVADVLRSILKMAPGTYSDSIALAAGTLLNTNNPAFSVDVLRMLATPGPALISAKQTTIDALTRHPQVLGQPATAVVLQAVLDSNESPALAAAASHALSLIHSAKARDALVSSPLFASSDPQLKLRALWDLSAQPAPYPPAATAIFQRLAADPNSQVATTAQALLKRR